MKQLYLQCYSTLQWKHFITVHSVFFQQVANNVKVTEKQPFCNFCHHMSCVVRCVYYITAAQFGSKHRLHRVHACSKIQTFSVSVLQPQLQYKDAYNNCATWKIYFLISLKNVKDFHPKNKTSDFLEALSFTPPPPHLPCAVFGHCICMPQHIWSPGVSCGAIILNS